MNHQALKDSFQERKPINGDDMVTDNTVKNGYLNHLEMF